MYVTKKNGRIVVYDTKKIIDSMLKANAETFEDLSETSASNIADTVFSRLTDEKELITTQDIRECVFSVLNENGLMETARHYMEYDK